MANCVKCGAQLPPGVAFCPGCGASAAPPPPPPPGQNQYYAGPQRPGPASGILDTPDSTAQFHPQDIAQNKVMAVLAYIGILVLVPWFAAPNSPYARFHAKQGIPLLILDVAYAIVSILLGLIKTTTYVWGLPVRATPWFITLIIWLIGLPIFALSILGIVYAATGRAKELPIIGKFKIVK